MSEALPLPRAARAFVSFAALLRANGLSVDAGALPLYGMCTIFTPVMALKSSPARWFEPPLPEDPKLSAPGLALASGVTVLNSPGTVDADYRGEVRVILVNLGTESYTVERGGRIAQLVLGATMQAMICEVASLDETTRGVRGFGSTGTGRERSTD